MRKRRLMAGLALTAGLGIGSLAGVILGVPGVSAAQTTTTPPATEEPAPTTPANPGAEAPGERGPRDGKNCPEKDGAAKDGAEGSSTDGATAFHRGPRGGAAVQSL